MSQENVNVNLQCRTTIRRGNPTHENPYAMVSKSMLRDQNISLKALGLWVRCSAQKNYIMSMQEIFSLCKEGKDAVRSLVKELIEAEYITHDYSLTPGKGTHSKYIINNVLEEVK